MTTEAHCRAPGWPLTHSPSSAGPKQALCLENSSRDLGDEAEGSPWLAGDRKQLSGCHTCSPADCKTKMARSWSDPEHPCVMTASAPQSPAFALGAQAHCCNERAQFTPDTGDCETTFIRPGVAMGTIYGVPSHTRTSASPGPPDQHHPGTSECAAYTHLPLLVSVRRPAPTPPKES